MLLPKSDSFGLSNLWRSTGPVVLQKYPLKIFSDSTIVRDSLHHLTSWITFLYWFVENKSFEWFPISKKYDQIARISWHILKLWRDQLKTAKKRFLPSLSRLPFSLTFLSDRNFSENLANLNVSVQSNGVFIIIIKKCSHRAIRENMIIHILNWAVKSE